MAALQPDRFFSRITVIDIKRDIVDAGFSHVLLDVDNTLLTRDTHEVPQDVRAWLRRAQDAGLTLCLVSNNWHHGVYDLAAELGLPLVAKAIKPLPHAFLLARRKVAAPRKSTLVIGDQLITDVWGAHLTGLRAFLLKPLVSADLKHTLLLRHLEAAVLGKRLPER